MVRRFNLLMVGLVMTAWGCQPADTGLVQHLPEPNFNPPPVVMASLSISAPAPTIASSQQQRTTVTHGFTVDRAWIPPVAPRAWNWIVIHHSATPSGSAAEFDKMHREKGWDELGYHFVIGNGTGSGNGQVEVGPRWPKQKWGAHAKTPDNRFNDYGIGICLVGNFDIERPTQQQMESLARLVAYLMRTYHIAPANILGHRDTKPTDCPGRNLNVAQVRAMAMQMLAESDAPTAPVAAAGSRELLTSVGR